MTHDEVWFWCLSLSWFVKFHVKRKFKRKVHEKEKNIQYAHMCLPYHRMQLLILYRTRPGNFLNSFYFVQYAASTEPTRRSSRVEWMNQGMNEWMHQSKRVYTWVSPCAKCHTEWIQLSWSTLSSFTQSFICVMMYNSVDRLLSLSLSLMCVCVCVCVKDQLTWSSSAIVIHHSCKPLYRSETLPLSFIHSFIRSFIHASKYRMHNPPSEQTWVLSCWSSSAIVIHHSCKPHLHQSETLLSHSFIHSFVHSFMHRNVNMHNPPSEQTWMLSCEKHARHGRN